MVGGSGYLCIINSDFFSKAPALVIPCRFPCLGLVKCEEGQWGKHNKHAQGDPGAEANMTNKTDRTYMTHKTNMTYTRALRARYNASVKPPFSRNSFSKAASCLSNK